MIVRILILVSLRILRVFDGLDGAYDIFHVEVLLLSFIELKLKLFVVGPQRSVRFLQYIYLLVVVSQWLF